MWVLRAIVRCLMTVTMYLKVPNTDHDAESEQPRPSQGATQKVWEWDERESCFRHRASFVDPFNDKDGRKRKLVLCSFLLLL